MPEYRFITMAGGLLRPDDEDTSEAVRKWGVGAFITGAFKKPRNPKFHRKFMSLLNTLFDEWIPQKSNYKGVEAQKSFKNFRKEITILAGYYDIVCSLKGESRVEAKSISFASMDDIEFEKLYMAVHKIGMQKVLNDEDRIKAGHAPWTERDLDATVDRLMGYV